MNISNGWKNILDGLKFEISIYYNKQLNYLSIY